MILLLLGDIVGSPGVRAVRQLLPGLIDTHHADVVIANAENAANGSGLTPDLYAKLKAAGVDGMTLGDHAFRKKQIYPLLQEAPDLIRPANLPAKARGRGQMTIRKPGLPPVHVTTILGRLFMNTLQGDDPFAAADHFFAATDASQTGEKSVRLLEIHAEATSEKIAMGWYASGRAACVFGTHTHVATADARILPPNVPGSGGPEGPPPVASTAYITDLGMSGPTESVLGRQVDRVLKFMATATPAAFDVPDLPATLQGVKLRLDPSSLRALEITPISATASHAG